MTSASLGKLRGHPVGRVLGCLLLLGFSASSAVALPLLSPMSYGESGGGMSVACGNTTTTLSGPGSVSGSYPALVAARPVVAERGFAGSISWYPPLPIPAVRPRSVQAGLVFLVRSSFSGRR
jgi:hypothetical protein